MDGFHTITLGCKLNQFDTAAIEAELAQRGLAAQPDVASASVVIVNTCTVTAKADAEARRLVRSVRRRNGSCRLLVTGCYAELDPEVLRAIPGVDRVFGNRDKPRLPTILDELGIAGRSPGAGAPLARLADEGDRGCGSALALPGALHFGDRSRAFLRVQEGCNLRCSYCVIPRVRGASRSVPAERLERALASLVEAGYREVVLTGVNTGDYGKDLDPVTPLEALLERLLARIDRLGVRARIRLNSLEPLTVTDGIVGLIAADPRLCAHLQIPLQSGSEAVLRGMRRNYRLSQYEERTGLLRERIPDVGLGADVIVGFPGETDARFEETYAFIERSELNYLHVFAWSPRPGTAAAEIPAGQRVHGGTVRRRSARLRELAARKGERFRERFVDRTREAVVLGDRRADGRIRALTDNFIEVGLSPANGAGASAVQRGKLIDLRMADAASAIAVPVGDRLLLERSDARALGSNRVVER